MSRPSSGPPACSSFRASRRAGSECARPMPVRRKKAPALRSEPASEAVCDTVRRAPSSLRPSFKATRGDAPLARLPGRGGEGRRVLQGLDDEPDGGDPAVVEEGLERVRGSDAGAVPEGHHRRDRHRPEVHREGDREVAALRHDGDPPVAAQAPVLVGPERRAVEVVDEAVAVGAEDGHLARRLDEGRLEARSLLPRFGEARGVADRAPRPPGGERPHHLDGAVAPHPDEGGVRRLGQLLDRAVATKSADRLSLRVDGVDGTREVHAPALLDDALRLAAADRADRAGIEEAREIHGHS